MGPNVAPHNHDPGAYQDQRESPKTVATAKDREQTLEQDVSAISHTADRVLVQQRRGGLVERQEGKREQDAVPRERLADQ